MGREENVAVFNDTAMMCKSDKRLRQAISEANAAQVLICENEPFALTVTPKNAAAKIIVSRKRTLEAASDYARAGKKVCVLNFASSHSPGGGVTRGASAQEEAICRCSTLYRSLIEPQMRENFYVPHRAAGNRLNNDDCIYTPGVVVFKTDTNAPEIMPTEDWYSVNVITCAAPDLREGTDVLIKNSGLSAGENLRILHEKRMRRILSIAAENKNDVIILGAFGCGAFKNPPDIVANAIKTVLTEFINYFETVEFAVYCSPRDDTNFKIFNKIIS